MKSICTIVSALFLIAAPIGQIYGLPSGAPTSACSTMTPDHDVETQPLTTSPFTTELPDGDFSVMGESVRLELVSKNTDSSFRGFMVMAIDINNATVGTFSLVSDGHTMDCLDGKENAATHSNNNDKKKVSLTWTPPPMQMGEITFKTTFVLKKSTFWVKTESKVLTIGHTDPAATTKAPEVTTQATASQAQSTWTSLIVVSLIAFLMRF